MKQESFSEVNLEDAQKPDGPITCLGLVFENDQARKNHFTIELSRKLKDPEFRKIEGFPIGSDEDILELSDPPFFTACPNPWLGNFIKNYGRQYESNENYAREPFAADVSEGKYDPLYKLHPYHTKVPHKAIMRYLLHYTQPGDLVFDGFCGTGMTGVAAYLCGDQSLVEELGYRVDNKGEVYQQVGTIEKPEWASFSRVGQRCAILSDLSPAATFIADRYNTPLEFNLFKKQSEALLENLKNECVWMYQTLHEPSQTQVDEALSIIRDNSKPDLGAVGTVGQINYVVWSDVFSCPDCTGEIVFWKTAVDIEAGEILETFNCPHCALSLTKRDLTRKWIEKNDLVIDQVIRQAKQVAVRISYTAGKHRYEKEPDQADQALIDKIYNSDVEQWVPCSGLPDGFNTRQPRESHGITHMHHFYTARCARLLSHYRARCKSLDDLFLLTRIAAQLTIRYRFTYQNGTWGAGGGPMSGTLYVPSLIKELSPIEQLHQASKDQLKRLKKLKNAPLSIISTSSSTKMNEINDSSIDYIFLDPPFGANIMYSELNLLWESWLKVRTNNVHEAIENSAQQKSLDDYRMLMQRCFAEAFRILKPGRWMTVEFSNTQASVWNSIQSALQMAGFVVANVSVLDKQKTSFKAATSATAVKQDLVISAYKPNGGFEERFQKEVESEDAVWDFVRTHLKYLPIIKLQDSLLQFVPERDPRILFDQMVAYYVRKGHPVPISSPEFQMGLHNRFVERDGMFFLPNQAVEYDRKKMVSDGLHETVEMFVKDEASMIQWLRLLINKKPQTFADLNPQFMQQLGGWSKNEAQLDLRELLNQNFLCYDAGPVPEQIHAYLSTNWKEFRNLAKTDVGLAAKAKDRWYVPDPTKSGDLEKLREKALLKEFDEYKQTKKKLKVFRLEAVRAGFKRAWQERDYSTIVSVADKIPNEILEEDPKLLMWYDQAVTRSGESK